MPLARNIEHDIRNASKIRKLFEEGIRLKEIHGDKNVADLSLGNPVVEPPEEFVETVSELIRVGGGMHRYMPNLGFPAVRQAVAGGLTAEGYFRGLGPNHVMMCTGAAAGMNVVLKTILNPGENVIVSAPYFVEYKSYVENHGGELIVVAPRDDFSLDVKKIRDTINRETRAVIVNSPNNPTGVVYSRENLSELVDVLHRRKEDGGQTVYVISDEPYREIVYEGACFTSVASLYAESFMVYSYSKSLSIAGERIGYVALHPDMGDSQAIMNGMAICNRILGFVNAPALMQRAVATVNVRVDVGDYRVRRDRIKRVLEDSGYEFANPQGTFYIFARCLGDEEAFIEKAKDMLLLIVPGSTFGYPGWFRIAYCVDDDTIDLACQKLKDLAQAYQC
jgi:aspartate aminotransferase